MGSPNHRYLDVLISSPATSIDIYRQGATAEDTITYNPLDVIDMTVDSVGALAVSDTVQLGTSATTLRVNAVTPPSTVTLKNTTGSAITVSTGDRLLPTNNRTLFYEDIFGLTSKTSTLTADATTHHAAAYVRVQTLDYIVSGGGSTPQLTINAMPSDLFSSSTWVNAADFSSIQAAIDFLSTAGGTVYIPSGTYTLTSALSIPYGTNGIRLLGDGIFRTIITTASTSTDLISIKGSFITLEGLSIQGPGSSGSGRGIVVGDPGASPGHVLSNILITDCRIEGTSSWALFVVGDSNTNLCTLSAFVRSQFILCRSNGSVYLGGKCTTLAFYDCLFGMAEPGGTVVNGYLLESGTEGGITSLTLENCVFEEASDAQSWVKFADCICVRFGRCYFEDSRTHSGTPSWLMEFSGDTHGVVIDATTFARGNGDVCRGINFSGLTHSATVSAPEFFSASGMNTDDSKADINVGNSGSEVVVLGGWRATNSTSGEPQLVDASGRGGQLTALRVHVPRVALGSETPPHLNDGDMLVDTTGGGAVLKVRLGGAWKTVTVT